MIALLYRWRHPDAVWCGACKRWTDIEQDPCPCLREARWDAEWEYLDEALNVVERPKNARPPYSFSD